MLGNNSKDKPLTPLLRTLTLNLNPMLDIQATKDKVMLLHTIKEQLIILNHPLKETLITPKHKLKETLTIPNQKLKLIKPLTTILQ